MANFVVTGLDKDGKECTIQVDAASKKEATDLARIKGIKPYSMRIKGL